MTIRILSFTNRGFELAEKIAAVTGGKADRCTPGGLAAWTGKAFAEATALIYVGAAGIAVRAIAPFLTDKASDPAVLVIDETGRYVIPILSGHIGGANALAERVASAIGAEAIVTTATDRHGIFAVDVWAASQGCRIPETKYIKSVSGKLLQGETVRFYSDFPIAGRVPDGVEAGSKDKCDFALTVHFQPDRLLCVPGIVVLGIGCKKGVSAARIEDQFQNFLAATFLLPESIIKVCTVDRKKDEPGLLEFCEKNRWHLESFSAEQLQNAPGRFRTSDFVKSAVGVDNVCERSAVLGSGGPLIAEKFASNGVTFAAARMPFYPNWRTKNG